MDAWAPCPPTSGNDVSAFSGTNKVTRPKSGAVKDKLIDTKIFAVESDDGGPIIEMQNEAVCE